MMFICKKKNIYLTCLRLHPENIKNMNFLSFVHSNNEKNKQIKQIKNISIDKFIKSTYGNVKLYKSKKRLELRLSKDIINNECSIQLY